MVTMLILIDEKSALDSLFFDQILSHLLPVSVEVYMQLLAGKIASDSPYPLKEQRQRVN